MTGIKNQGKGYNKKWREEMGTLPSKKDFKVKGKVEDSFHYQEYEGIVYDEFLYNQALDNYFKV